jgi:hypothetical protein
VAQRGRTEVHARVILRGEALIRVGP